MPDYGEYSRCPVQSAGEHWSGPNGGAPSGKWAWAPGLDVGSTSSIQWGHPATWPPAYRELFDRDTAGGSDRMFLRGWYDNGTFYRMQVSEAYVGDEHGGNLQPIAVHPEGWQTYCYWNIPTEPYTLDTYGCVIEEASGNKVTFRHQMTWWPPKLVANRYWPKRDCIRQRESWWDDNPALDGETALKVVRTNYLAKGAGMAWAVRQEFPNPWEADLKDWWLWPR